MCCLHFKITDNSERNKIQSALLVTCVSTKGKDCFHLMTDGSKIKYCIGCS